ncbi:inosine monophosphate dehydrogenase [Canariomyces notabilis]|uniref:Inosine monophosphate dehydrogenase n=1 Tax=Canariomyces notabilis TaxID=2074819 RepID=A0AAN6QH31_9PEZI|nr:inosine monophosphate dehydrogenase [Canariomyces arenarius]
MKLSELFPHAKTPLIISAPMMGTANGTLAAEVSKAGGLGVIPGGFDFSPSSSHLKALSQELSTARTILSIGFLLFSPTLSTSFLTTALPILLTHRPAAVWLFAPRPEEIASGVLTDVIAALKREGFVVLWQVGTVAAAREAVDCGTDVLVVQGADAGGHQFAACGAGVVSLVPEVVDMLRREFGEGKDVPPVVAAGGIVDGRGVAAAMALGAEGIVMGTRFIASKEAWAPEWRQKIVIETADGGPSTVKTAVLDDIQGTGVWPDVYDGRAIIGKSWEDHVAGMPLEENIRLFKEADSAGDVSRKITWAGTGVGMVKEVRPAGDIVRDAREEAIQLVRKLQSAI